MQFKENQSIYLQIADYICEKILLKEWKPEERLASVREMAVQLEVNPNTVMRTYDFMQQQGIIHNQRGIGYFISPDAYEQTIRYRRQEFLQNDLPDLFRNLYLLGMNTDDLKPGFDQFVKQYFSQR